MRREPGVCNLLFLSFLFFEMFLITGQYGQTEGPK